MNAITWGKPGRCTLPLWRLRIAYGYHVHTPKSAPLPPSQGALNIPKETPLLRGPGTRSRRLGHFSR